MSREIVRPTLVVDERRARRNIRRMAEKARAQGVSLRPHFKTHQSAAIGEWFRQEGVRAITVSSVAMARYFAAAGWDDMTIAFPLNVREWDEIAELGNAVRLGILVASVDPVGVIAHSQDRPNRLQRPLDVWIEVDDGTGRSGIPWDRCQPLWEVANTIRARSPLRLRGLLTHAGRAYHAAGPGEIRAIYHETVARINAARQFLAEQGIRALEVSVGDTPGCTLVDDLGAVDEIRPGNFVFYDVQQLQMGVCQADEIAVAVACPVVARYPERQEVVIYGGAVHLSKDTVVVKGQVTFGLVALETPDGWSAPLEGAFVARLTQEHGVVHLPEPIIGQLRLGDLLYVLPAHSCLAVSALGSYRTLQGDLLPAMTLPSYSP